MLIGIVADDLTGAADSVAPFAQQGYVAGVSFGERETNDLSWDALSVITGLRDRLQPSRPLIDSFIRSKTRLIAQYGPEIYFKKIDSTLRGHLHLELDGMRSELGGDRIALICPASPANGRIVENGILYVGDMPLSETEFVTGIADPERFETVRTAFEMADDPTAAEIPLPTLRQGIEVVEEQLERLIAAGIGTIFCDAVTPDDLRTLAQILLKRPERYLPVGSAGFTRAISESLSPARNPYLPHWDTAAFAQGCVLVIVASMHPMSRRQAQRLIDAQGARQVTVDPNRIGLLVRELTSPQRPSGEQLLVLLTSEEKLPDERGYSFKAPFHWMTVLEANQTIVSPFDGYVITGGETALQVCQAMRGKSLQIFGESEPGIVRAILNRESGLASVRMILKAGGFGDEGTLARCLGLE